jgi:hypothetical protein
MESLTSALPEKAFDTTETDTFAKAASLLNVMPLSPFCFILLIISHFAGLCQDETEVFSSNKTEVFSSNRKTENFSVQKLLTFFFFMVK